MSTHRTGGDMKAMHLYIGVFIGCATVIGMGVSYGRQMGEIAMSLRQISTSVERLETTSARQASEIQALRSDLNGVKLETNTWMAFQEGQKKQRGSGVTDEWRSLRFPKAER